MITKQELEKLKQTGCCLIAREGSEQPNSHEHHICDCTVLRLIEALEVATEALKRHYMIECIYCVGDGITEEAPDFQNAYGEHGLHTKECLLCRPAKEALNKIYGE